LLNLRIVGQKSDQGRNCLYSVKFSKAASGFSSIDGARGRELLNICPNFGGRLYAPLLSGCDEIGPHATKCNKPEASDQEYNADH